VRGVTLACGAEVEADAVLFAAGHSAREMYEELVKLGAEVRAKDFAVGFRVEHPQHVVNAAQYGSELAAHCKPQGPQGPRKGQSQGLPPASYRLATTVGAADADPDPDADADADADAAAAAAAVPSRGVYSFCMCPGGQIVPTSIEEGKLCVNGMSYSNRGSKWANSALVVSVGSQYGDYADAGADGGGGSDSLAGLAFQEEMEGRAAAMGGGELRCPVQRVSDFLRGELSEAPLPPSSYRLGVTSAPLHELYPPALTEALRRGLRDFAGSMDGFDGDAALLHGVETRTSAPVQIARDDATCECAGLPGLYPAGEGAGHAGGIVSAAVDGIRVAEALLKQYAAAEEGRSPGEDALV